MKSIRRLIGLALIPAALMGCANSTQAPLDLGSAELRSKRLMDSGLPLSEGLAAYDVNHYTIRTTLLIEEKAIEGSASVLFRTKQSLAVLELDFDGNYVIDGIVDGDGIELAYEQTDDQLFVTFNNALHPDTEHEVTVTYHGVPIEAERPPWDGGFVWESTPSGEPWIATAFQGEGCDIWWPCKDHPSGEPLGVDLYITVPNGLTAVSNGVLVSQEPASDTTETFHWQTRVSTNPYVIALNVGPYELLETSYTSTNGTEVAVKFWPIAERLEPAKELFEREFLPTIHWFEATVGPYPWGHEKLGVVETPHLGMEHQTNNAYGNQYRRGSYGFDWLFHHELAHEWFGNAMTHKTVSDLWLHEGFGAYMQPLYSQYLLGDAVMMADMYKSYLGIKGCAPVAPREELSEDQLYFNGEGGGPGGDIYAKGEWVLHSLRYLMGDEAFWRAVRRLIYNTAEPQTLKAPIEARFRSTDDFLAIASEEAGEDLSWFFEVYLRKAPVPVLQQRQVGDDMILEWQTPDELLFPMPIPVRVNGVIERVEFDGNRAVLTGVSEDQILVDPYLNVLRKLPSLPTCEERAAEAAAK